MTNKKIKCLRTCITVVLVVVVDVVGILSVTTVVLLIIVVELKISEFFSVAFGAGGSTQHFMEGDGQATSSNTSKHIIVARACTHTPGQSFASAVLVMESNKPLQ